MVLTRIGSGTSPCGVLWRTALVGGTVVAGLFATAGCGRPRSDGAPPAPGSLTKLRFAFQDRVADAASMVAVEKGFFSEEALDVQPMVFSSGPACSEALLSGSADIGTMGDTTAVIAAARSPVKIIASHGGGEHRHRIVVAEDSSIRAPSDLVGRRVAVKKGTSTYGGLLAWAQASGIDLSEVRVTEMRPGDMADALLSGAVDAIVASEPTPSVVEERGGRELATLGGLGNTYPILLVARDEFIAANPEAVSAFVRAMSRAAVFISENPEESAEVVGGRTGLGLETTSRAMSHHYYDVGLDRETRASLLGTAEFLVSSNTLETIPDLSGAITDRFLSDTGSP
jgi:aliphatic sulfonates family ABC transporter substrate-binding protein